jgi:hypothetical protein
VEDTDDAKDTAETWTPDKGIAVFTDGSKFEDGYTGVRRGAEEQRWLGRPKGFPGTKQGGL